MSVAQLFLIIHLLAISLGIGIGFSNLVGFRVAKSLGGDMAKGIAGQREALIPYGDAVFVTIIGSGLVLLWNMGGGSGLGGWFQVKLAAVVIWAVGYILMRLRIRKFLASRDMGLVPLIRSMAHGVIAAACLSLIFAVMTFNG
jgi:hypothetical protein